ncbi:inner membrane protein YiaA [Thalassotalea ganghwensis]
MSTKPTKAFVFTSIAMLIAGVAAFCIGLLNAEMQLNEKGYYFAILIFGLFSFVSLQKTIRDKLEGQNISKPYSIMCWVSSAIAIALLTIGLINADLLLSEKGFYAMAYLLSGFAAITVQKNVRDNAQIN